MQQKILVIDDDANFLRFVTEVLIGAGYDVRGVDQPLAAVDLARAFLPDLAVVDISMPGKDGIEVAKELKASGIPCMFLTARRALEGVTSATEAGGIAYLEKPVPSSKLLWTVKALLDRA